MSTTFFRKYDSVKSMTYEISRGGQKKVPFCYTVQRGIKGNIMKQALFIGAIASVLAFNAYATSSTVTSRDYVDVQDALKQNKIPATGTNASTPGDTVVTYTTTGNGVIGERGIYAGNRYNESTDANKLVTADVAARATECVYNAMPNVYCTEYDSNNNCLLMGVGEPSYDCNDPWNGRDVVSCDTDNDCAGHGFSCGGACVDGFCRDKFC